MPTPKAAISEALDQLDHKNDALWTDDGSPIVEAVQRLCNDEKITRQMINDAKPGFARKPLTSVNEETQVPEVKNTTIAPVGSVEDDLDLEDMVGEEQPREMAKRHVDAAAEDILEARRELSAAQQKVVNCERIHARKVQLFNSKFPPMHASEAIKIHLAAQQEQRRRQVEGDGPVRTLLNPVDATMADKRRPNGRNAASHKPAPAPFLPRKASLSY